MNTVSMNINGKPVEAEIAPRMSLADFLRENQMLTATHIGCEHGVCGACTLVIDGEPARSCITYAAACEGAEIITLEGLEDDPLMTRLRQAFHENHALQCGYCTPGMLVTARDIITRLPDADEARLRRELAGNLCRCTGYLGIVNAITEVMKERGARASEPQRARPRLGPLGSRDGSATVLKTPREARITGGKDTVAQTPPSAEIDLAQEDWDAVRDRGTELTQSFEIGYSRDRVWAFFDDLDKVARCMPGARLTSTPQNNSAHGEITVKLGPITSAFAGVVDVKRDDAEYLGTVRGAGLDTKSDSRARGLITYKISDAAGGPDNERARVDVAVKFLLAGALAQFSRSGLVKDVADHLTAQFAKNLELSLSGKTPEADAATLSAASIARAAIWGRIRAIARSLFGGRK